MENENIRKYKRIGNVTVVELTGKLDVGGAPSFDKFIKGLLDKGEYKIICDMSRLEYISSAGIGVFVSSLQIARKNNGDVILSSMLPDIFQVFEILGFSKIFTIKNSMDEAKKYFK